MNREQRRNMNKQTSDAMNYLESPCTITEAVQLARGVAQDVVADYSNQTRPLQVSMSLQLEIMKSVVIGAGLITEEEFKNRYIKMAQEFEKRQKELVASSRSSGEDSDQSPKMSVSAGDVEIIKSQE